jgi:hypothetical protein
MATVTERRIYSSQPGNFFPSRQADDLTGFGAQEPDVGDRQEQGWTEREEERK